MATAWLASVPHAFVRSTYERTPEDVVKRASPSAGPPLRDLRAPTRAQIVAGEISMTDDQFDAFNAWRMNDLDYGNEPFDLPLYDYVAPRAVEARFRGGPVAVKKSGGVWRVKLEAMISPPEPTPSALSAFAALHKADPASWPSGVPGCPRRADYERQTESQVVRPDDRNSPGGVLISRLEGNRERVGLTLSSADLEVFENWFETDAVMGVRDILFPVPGGVHTGCFGSGYKVRGASAQEGWRVTFERYLEARA